MGREEIGKRLRRVEGQIRGLQRMVAEERECEAILTQLMAARAALDGVGLLILDDFVARCLLATDAGVAQQRLSRMVNLIFPRYSVPGAEDGRAQPDMPENSLEADEEE